MFTTHFKLDEKGQGGFYVMEDEKQAGEMAISISGKELTVYHTEVLPEYEGKGLAKMLLNDMVTHARENNMKVIALCPYVKAQFQRHPELYADLIP